MFSFILYSLNPEPYSALARLGEDIRLGPVMSRHPTRFLLIDVWRTPSHRKGQKKEGDRNAVEDLRG
ncbi:hypothetical protein J6590_017366 [Homalodisca vitripennis]|nr:hypothetical protein J6590_017366 [Homalodisca vitripennis]